MDSFQRVFQLQYEHIYRPWEHLALLSEIQ